MVSTVIGLLGLALIVVGIALVFPPAAFVAAGAGLVRIAVALDRPAPPEEPAA